MESISDVWTDTFYSFPDFVISSHHLQYILKSKESGEISVSKRQSQKRMLEIFGTSGHYKQGWFCHVNTVLPTPVSSLGQHSTKMDSGKSGKLFCVHHNLKLFWENTDAAFSGVKRREAIQHVIRSQFKSLNLWWYRGASTIRLVVFTFGKTLSMLKKTIEVLEQYWVPSSQSLLKVRP